MKKTFYILIFLLFPLVLFSQVPQGFNYQAIIRGSGGQELPSQTVGMQISILQYTPDGSAVYVERFTPTTNDYGLVSIIIGTGDVQTDLGLDWEDGPYFLKVEVDLAGGVSYTHVGTNQIWSVPYAFISGTANNLSGADGMGEGSFLDADFLDGLDHTYFLSEAAFISHPSYSISTGDITNWDNKLDVEVDGSTSNEIQNLEEVLLEGNDGALNQIKNIADPTDDQDAATKAYVDELKDQILELQFDVGQKVQDYEGNIYDAVRIGDQIWMAENLRSTKYNDGTNIPLVTDNTAWMDLSTPGYCWYNNDAPAYAETYGALYNNYAVATGKLCPTGWHVSTNDDWLALTSYIGGVSVAGGKLKETGTSHWDSPNVDATDEYGFTALPGGLRNFMGVFDVLVEHGYYWGNTASPIVWYFVHSSSEVYTSSTGDEFGFSVRCVKD